MFVDLFITETQVNSRYPTPPNEDLVTTIILGNIFVDLFMTEIQVNSSPSAAHMRQWTESSLVQVMSCRLFGAKPSPGPMLTYCQLDSREQILMKFEPELIILIQENAIENIVCQNGGHFV